MCIYYTLVYEISTNEITIHSNALDIQFRWTKNPIPRSIFVRNRQRKKREKTKIRNKHSNSIGTALMHCTCTYWRRLIHNGNVIIAVRIMLLYIQMRAGVFVQWIRNMHLFCRRCWLFSRACLGVHKTRRLCHVLVALACNSNAKVFLEISTIHKQDRNKHGEGLGVR